MLGNDKDRHDSMQVNGNKLLIGFTSMFDVWKQRPYYPEKPPETVN